MSKLHPHWETVEGESEKDPLTSVVIGAPKTSSKKQMLAIVSLSLTIAVGMSLSLTQSSRTVASIKEVPTIEVTHSTGVAPKHQVSLTASLTQKRTGAGKMSVMLGLTLVGGILGAVLVDRKNKNTPA